MLELGFGSLIVNASGVKLRVDLLRAASAWRNVYIFGSGRVEMARIVFGCIRADSGLPWTGSRRIVSSRTGGLDGSLLRSWGLPRSGGFGSAGRLLTFLILFGHEFTLFLSRNLHWRIQVPRQLPVF